MEKVRLKKNEFEAIQFIETDERLSEIKMFCEDYCKITYEHANGIGSFWLVKIDVSNSPSEDWKILPVGGWVVKNPNGVFNVYNDIDFKEAFETIDGKEVPLSINARDVNMDKLADEVFDKLKDMPITVVENNTDKAKKTYDNVNANGHEFVDLGLPSGRLWATCNVGAVKPEDYGNYFMWGSVKPNDYDICDWEHCPYCVDPSDPWSDSSWEKYRKNEGGLKELELSDDAAHVLMGGDWRMPTKDDFKELYDNTDSVWTSVDSIKGRKFISKTDATKFIFIPASGYRYGSQFRFQGSNGGVWSSTLISGDSSSAHRLSFGNGGVYPTSYDGRCYGFCLRGIL